MDAALKTAIKEAGGLRPLARLIGISAPSINDWKRVPAARVLKIEAVTGVHRSKLRPDLYPPAEYAKKR